MMLRMRFAETVTNLSVSFGLQAASAHGDAGQGASHPRFEALQRHKGGSLWESTDDIVKVGCLVLRY